MELDTPIQFWKLIQPDSFIELMVEQSRLYATQNQAKLGKFMHLLTVENMRLVQGILLLMGYCKVPSRRYYWQSQDDCYNKLVAESIGRNNFEGILACLHFADNERNDGVDKYYKVRPLFNNLNANCNKYNKNTKEFSVDESMVQYFGFHSTKQFIKGKPIRYGFKIWTCATSDGMPAWFEPYCGTSTLLPDLGLGQGPNVVLGLVNKAGLRPGMRVTFDNLFTSTALISKLSDIGIGGTGTIRQNRRTTIPIPDKKEAERTMARGEYKCLYKDDMVICCWRDNRPVYVLSNVHNKMDQEDHTGVAKRRVRGKGQISIERPEMVTQYNINMGGVDNVDQMYLRYRIATNKNKWWFCFFPWSLNVSAVSA